MYMFYTLVVCTTRGAIARECPGDRRRLNCGCPHLFPKFTAGELGDHGGLADAALAHHDNPAQCNHVLRELSWAVRQWNKGKRVFAAQSSSPHHN